VSEEPFLRGLHPSWADALAPVASRLVEIGRELRDEPYLPAEANVMRCFTYPLDRVRVLVVGQDPYPTPGHSIGLAFAVERHVQPLPRSLKNIYRELHDDLGIPPAPHGDLTAWSEQGVMLLNRVLTVRPGETGSHQRLGWQEVTDAAIRALVDRGGPLVAILWGNQAGTLRPQLGDVPIVASAHPSPLSVARGFFGSKPFSHTNTLLEQQGADPINWRLPHDIPASDLEETHDSARPSD
jgi:uracil-DNA glycosylase